MRRPLSVSSIALAAGLSLLASQASSQAISSDLSGFFDSREITVNVDNFVRAATDAEIGKYLPLAGGVNQLFHMREPTPVDKQPTIRMNRDLA